MIITKKLIINLCDEIPLAADTDKASYVSSKIGRSVSRITVRILMKDNREKIMNDKSSNSTRNGKRKYKGTKKAQVVHRNLYTVN